MRDIRRITKADVRAADWHAVTERMRELRSGGLPLSLHLEEDDLVNDNVPFSQSLLHYSDEVIVHQKDGTIRYLKNRDQ